MELGDDHVFQIRQTPLSTGLRLPRRPPRPVSPPPAPHLFDPHLERLLVSAVIRHPEQLNTLTIAVTDLTDFQAKEALAAAVNVFAGGGAVTAESVRLDLQASHERRGPHRAGEERRVLSWFDDLVGLYADAGAPPVDGWVRAILDLRVAREVAVTNAEPIPRRTPRGPRADNVEPVRLGEAFRRYKYEADGESKLVRWARAWWRYNGTRYVEHDDELLDRDLIAFLDVVVAPQSTVDKKTGATRTDTRRVTCRNKTLSEVRKALTFVMPVIAGGAPQWTSPAEGDPPAERLAVCGNGILDLETRKLPPATPRLFATTALGAPWLPDAPEPTAWLEFLHSLWGDDVQSIQTLQQMFGYLLTSDTSQQKIFAIIGRPRSGKGTIARILKALLGDDAVVNPTLASLERPFGLAPLVGKSAAIIGDARLGGHSDQQQVVERLLSISGEDDLSIDRKNRDPINVRLRVRVVLLSNELPKLYDTSGALASRFVILTLSKSFLGAEDTELSVKLLAELPGILRWALDGRDDLLEQGKFTVPLASETAAGHLRAISNPIGVFLGECCEFADGAGEEVDKVYQRYVGWCESNGREPANKQVFGRDLHTLHPDLLITQETRDSIAGKKRVRVYEGFRCL